MPDRGKNSTLLQNAQTGVPRLLLNEYRGSPSRGKGGGEVKQPGRADDGQPHVVFKLKVSGVVTPRLHMSSRHKRRTFTLIFNLIKLQNKSDTKIVAFLDFVHRLIF